MTIGHRTLVAAALTFCALGGAAAEITTSIEGTASHSSEVSLIARRIDGAASPIEVKVGAPGKSELSLPDGLWEIRVVDEGMWAAPVIARNVDSATLRLLPAVALTGTSSGITKLRAKFESIDHERVAGEVECEVAQNVWTCRVPRGRNDIRFSTPGMAPEHRSAISSASPPGDLALRFVAGASLSGWVQAETAVERAEVSLRGSGVSHFAHADKRGFFQFKGLAAGDYSLSARTKTLIAQTRSVKVLADVAAELREPLLLDTPKRLTLLVMPPLDPDGEPWKLLWGAAESQDVYEERLSELGQWSRDGLVAGSYDVVILDGRGGRWKSETITLGSEDLTASVAATGTKINGRVLLGGRPLQAKLSFGGEWGRTLESDEDGRFAGEIPLEENEERLILVESDTPLVHLSTRAKLERTESGESHLLLELSETTLMGRILNADRSPEPHGMVSVSGEGDTFEQVFAENDGTFQIAGLPPGKYSVFADSLDRQSRQMIVQLKMNEPLEVEIVLEPEEILRGKMTMGETPVVAATIFVLPRDSRPPFVPRTKTNERGNFLLRLPPGTTIFDGIAVHPAFDTVIARGAMKKDRVAWVPTSQIGGTLIVESPRPDHVLLLHKGAEVFARTVEQLSGGVEAPDRVTLPRLEPGEYSVCTQDKKTCVSDYLPPHGTLTLALKE